jgi:hypothetical protein
MPALSDVVKLRAHASAQDRARGSAHQGSLEDAATMLAKGKRIRGIGANPET